MIILFIYILLLLFKKKKKKDCSLGSVKNLTIDLAKLLMSGYQITGIIYIHTGMNE